MATPDPPQKRVWKHWMWMIDYGSYLDNYRHRRRGAGFIDKHIDRDVLRRIYRLKIIYA